MSLRWTASSFVRARTPFEIRLLCAAWLSLGLALAGCESTDVADAMSSAMAGGDGGRPIGSDTPAPGSDAASPGAAADASSPADAAQPNVGHGDAQAAVADASPDGQSSGPDAGPAADGGTEPTATCPTNSALRPGDPTRTVHVGGVARTFILHVPNGYTGTSPVPLVVDWHPIFGTGSAERSNSGYVQLSDKEGFLIAFPNGIDNAWNVGPCCTQSRTVDDVGFARALVKDIQSQACIDPKRIYTTGFSMGGGMSHYLACNAADLFAAAAPASFDLLAENEQPCKPARPITVISFRGTFDFVVPYDGGASNPPNGLPTIHLRGAVSTFEHWKELNGCTGTKTTSNGCETYADCKDGVETTLCTIQGGGHSYGDADLGWSTMKRFTLP